MYPEVYITLEAMGYMEVLQVSFNVRVPYVEYIYSYKPMQSIYPRSWRGCQRIFN